MASSEPGIAEAPPRQSLADAHLLAVLEAIVYIAEEPLTVAQLAAALDQEPDRIRALVARLVAEFDKPEHGVSIREVAGGYKMATKPEHHDSVRSFVKSLKAPLKLSLPALETLAVIAYKQPVTTPEIMEIRGVQGGGVLKTLLDRKLITEAGRKNVIGKPILYKTTKEFLIQFGLKDLSELPSLKEFEEIRRMAMADSEPAEAPAAERAAPAQAPELAAAVPEAPVSDAADADAAAVGLVADASGEAPASASEASGSESSARDSDIADAAGVGLVADASQAPAAVCEATVSEGSAPASDAADADAAAVGMEADASSEAPASASEASGSESSAPVSGVAEADAAGVGLVADASSEVPFAVCEATVSDVAAPGADARSEAAVVAPDAEIAAAAPPASETPNPEAVAPVPGSPGSDERQEH
jgi:segregation and condensation protein B